MGYFTPMIPSLLTFHIRVQKIIGLAGLVKQWLLPGKTVSGRYNKLQLYSAGQVEVHQF